MEHEEIAAAVMEWVRGSLPVAQAAIVAAHIESCPQCQAAAQAARALDRAREFSSTRVAAHPNSDALAGYAVSAHAEPIESLVRVGLHLKKCQDCQADIGLMRAAASIGWWRRARALVVGRGWESLPALAPALAVCVLLLAYPAWRGMRGGDGSVDPMPQGGGVTALVLQGTVRAEEELPELRLRSGQGLQPLLLDAAPRGATLTIRLVAEPDQIVWSLSGAAAEFWDQTNQLLGVMVPARVLRPGTMRVELVETDGASWFSARFRVVGTVD